MEYLIRDKEAFLEYSWHYKDTNISAWLCIHSLKNNASLATFVADKNLTKEKIKVLAAQKNVRLTQSGPVIGGAALGINIELDNPDFAMIVKEWLSDISSFLKSNVGFHYTDDEALDSVLRSVLKELDIVHPISSILNNQNIEEDLKITNQLDLIQEIKLQSPEIIPNGIEPLSIYSMINGWSMAVSIKNYFDKYSAMMFKRFSIINGWNIDTQFAAYYLAKYGVKITAIFQKDKALINREGFDASAIAGFIAMGEDFLSNDNWISRESGMEMLKKSPMDIAIDSIDDLRLTKNELDLLMNAGLEVVSQYNETENDYLNLFDSGIEQYLDAKISLLPIHISCLGRDRLKAVIMEGKLALDDGNIYRDIYELVGEAISRLNQVTSKQQFILRKSMEIGQVG